MINLIEAIGYRCLRDIQQPLGHFHVLVGPNASGKSTFLDTIGLLGDILSKGLEQSIIERAPSFQDLTWNRSLDHFEIALEAAIPEKLKTQQNNLKHSRVRYEMAIGLAESTGELAILTEKVSLREKPSQRTNHKHDFFPKLFPSRQSLLSKKTTKGVATVVNKVRGGNDNFYDETDKGWDHAFKLGPRKSTLANLPDDKSLKRSVRATIHANALRKLAING